MVETVPPTASDLISHPPCPSIHPLCVMLSRLLLVPPEFFSRTQPTRQVKQIPDNFQPPNLPLPAQSSNSQHSNRLSFAINGNLDLTAVSVTIAGENITMVFDSGSYVSLIDHEFYLSLKSCHMILEET